MMSFTAGCFSKLSGWHLSHLFDRHRLASQSVVLTQRSGALLQEHCLAASIGRVRGSGNPTLGSAFAVRVGHPCMPMNERERRELQRLRDEFLELMRREIDAALFDEEAKRRLGEAISRSMRQGNSEFSYTNTRPRRR